MTQEPSLRIATVYTRAEMDTLQPIHMNLTRWLRISEALARLGYGVDMIVNTKNRETTSHSNLRHVRFADVNWRDYDVIKTLFHGGITTLASAGGVDHPFIISKLGSVVGRDDETEGVYFFKDERKRLYEKQLQIARRSRYVTILTEASRRLWEKQHGPGNILMVPTGVDAVIPPPGRNPYAQFAEKIAVYIGNFYQHGQRETNLLWQNRFNSLGRLLRKKGIRLCLVGLGLTDQLEPDVVTHLGGIDNNRIWDYHHFAHVGIALAQGRVQHNESSKIYYYLRAGLPVVSEEPIPNNNLIRAANLGFIADYGNDEQMAELIEQASLRNWDRPAAIRHMVENHTWDRRVRLYHELIQGHFP